MTGFGGHTAARRGGGPLGGEGRWALLFLAPTLIGLAVLSAGPILATLAISVTEWDLLRAPRFVGVDNFVQLASDDRFLNALRNTAHANGMAFATIFWGADSPNSTNSYDWYRATLTQGSYYQAAGIVPDMYTLESWLPYIPALTVPESDITRFMGTAAEFRSQGHFPR